VTYGTDYNTLIMDCIATKLEKVNSAVGSAIVTHKTVISQKYNAYVTQCHH
jgi:deoxycytidylate deaminase